MKDYKVQDKTSRQQRTFKVVDWKLLEKRVEQGSKQSWVVRLVQHVCEADGDEVLVDEVVSGTDPPWADSDSDDLSLEELNLDPMDEEEAKQLVHLQRLPLCQLPRGNQLHPTHPFQLVCRGMVSNLLCYSGDRSLEEPPAMPVIMAETAEHKKSVRPHRASGGAPARPKPSRQRSKVRPLFIVYRLSFCLFGTCANHMAPILNNK